MPRSCQVDGQEDEGGEGWGRYWLVIEGSILRATAAIISPPMPLCSPVQLCRSCRDCRLNYLYLFSNSTIIIGILHSKAIHPGLLRPIVQERSYASSPTDGGRCLPNNSAHYSKLEAPRGGRVPREYVRVRIAIAQN